MQVSVLILASKKNGIDPDVIKMFALTMSVLKMSTASVQLGPGEMLEV